MIEASLREGHVGCSCQGHHKSSKFHTHGSSYHSIICLRYWTWSYLMFALLLFGFNVCLACCLVFLWFNHSLRFFYSSLLESGCSFCEHSILKVCNFLFDFVRTHWEEFALSLKRDFEARHLNFVETVKTLENFRN